MSGNKIQEETVLTRREEALKLLGCNPFGDCNKVWISGVIEEELTYDHKWGNENFYRTRIKVKRPKGKEDYVPIMISEFLLNDYQEISIKGKIVEVGGRFHSFYKMDEKVNSNWQTYVFVTLIKFHETLEELEDEMDLNAVYLEGQVHRGPFPKVLPSGRKVSEVLLKVNRGSHNGRYSYILCVAWDGYANCINNLKNGEKIKLYGKVHSRNYVIKYEDHNDYKEAYEISIVKIIETGI